MRKSETTDKFIAMIGFAKRAGKIVYGYDNLVTKRVRLLAVSDTASENLTDGIEKLAHKKNIPIVYAPELEKLVGNNVKALGLSDPDMANGIVDYITGGTTRYKIRLGLRR